MREMLLGSMDSFLKIAKWSFLKPQEKIQKNNGSVVTNFYNIFLPIFGYNYFFVEQVQCQVYEMITQFNFHWQPCALLFIEYNRNCS